MTTDKVQSIPARIRVSFGPEWKFTQVNGHCVADVSERAARSLFNKLGGMIVIPPKSNHGKQILHIIRVVSDAFGITELAIFSRQRPEHIAWPRQVSMWLSRELTTASLNEIGEVFDKDHGTVMHACRVVNDRCQTDEKTNRLIASLRRRITG